jgi:hypothetical protein
MAMIVICTHNVLGASEWGGHLWVYLQSIESLRRLGCEVYWLEDLNSEKESKKDANRSATSPASSMVLASRTS